MRCPAPASLRPLFAALALAFGAAQAAEVQVVMTPLAQVRGARPVMLADVAVIHGDDSALVQRLSRLPLGQPPRAGGSVLLERDAVERWARHQLGEAAQAVQWAGAPAVRVTARHSAVLPQDVASARREAVPAVVRGEWAIVRARSGPIELERRVEVLQDGAVGQAVRVRHAGTPDMLTARVVAPGHLEMEP